MTEPRSVKSADRALVALEYLANVRSATFSEIIAALKLPNSSGHHLLRTMVLRGFLELDLTTREYRLGVRVWELGQAYSTGINIAAEAQPLIDHLVDVTGETVQLAKLEGIENVYLAISESPHPMKLVSSVGKRLPAHATGVGKTLLAGLDDSEVRRRFSGVSLPRFTPQTLTHVEQIIRELSIIRERGYGTDIEEYVIGCRCVAMPIRDASGRTIAAMSVSTPTPRYSKSGEKRALAALTEAVGELSRRMGHRLEPTR